MKARLEARSSSRADEAVYNKEDCVSESNVNTTDGNTTDNAAQLHQKKM